jgi:WD repeat and SOF domain-containing protein 1
MKIKALSRAEGEYTRDRRDDVIKVQRNPDPALHPFERAREYTRAVNAVKLDRIFAKPLIGALDGHSDGISCMATNPKSLVAFVSGSADGELRMWDLTHKRTVWSAPAHAGIVSGISFTQNGETFLTCGDDKIVRQWGTVLGDANMADDDDDDEDSDDDQTGEKAKALAGHKRPRQRTGRGLRAGAGLRGNGETGDEVEPLQTFHGSFPFNGVDCSWGRTQFASCGDKVDIWDMARTEPVHSFKWGADSVTCVKFNPAQKEILGSTGADRSIGLYDLRAGTPIRKVILSMRSNKLAWNPVEPFNFTVANEDHNLYTFDMRKLDKALMVHKDHVSAVMDVSYSPTGREFVTGSYDRTVRIFPVRQGRSREVYHTRRMQRVFCANFTQDSRFVLSGSDDTNVRVWKSDASAQMGALLPREQRNFDYNRQLAKRYQHMPEMRVIQQRHVPRNILKAAKKKHVMHAAAQVRQEKLIAHSAPGSIVRQPERKKKVVKEFQ